MTTTTPTPRTEGHTPMPPEGGDISIVYKASEVIALGNRRYDEGYAAGRADRDDPRWRLTTWTLLCAIVAVVVVAWLIVDRAS